MNSKYLCFPQVLGDPCERSYDPQSVVTHRLRTDVILGFIAGAGFTKERERERPQSISFGKCGSLSEHGWQCILQTAGPQGPPGRRGTEA